MICDTPFQLNTNNLRRSVTEVSAHASLNQSGSELPVRFSLRAVDGASIHVSMTQDEAFALGRNILQYAEMSLPQEQYL